MINHIRIDRLRELCTQGLYAPQSLWSADGLSPLSFKEDLFLGTPHREDGYEDERFRDEKYHIGRVLWFAELLLTDEELVSPVEIDNVCDRSHIYPIPVILDGYHRIAAAVFAQRPTIRAHYGGRVDVLRYLEGKGRKPKW